MAQQVGSRLRLICTVIVFGLASFPASAEDAGWIDPATARTVLPYALISSDSYNTDASSSAIPGWTRVADWQTIFRKGGMASQISSAAVWGFYAAVYRNNITGEITIAYRGTQRLSGSDWINNVAAGVGSVPPQYDYAVVLAELVHAQYKNAPSITATGHSLGGGLATYASQQTPGISQVITFNSSRPPIVSTVTAGSVRQVNVVVPSDVFGDPNVKSDLGLGSLPGATYSVRSTTALPAGKSTVSQAKSIVTTHSDEGIVGGLQAVIKSSNALATSSAGTAPIAPKTSGGNLVGAAGSTRPNTGIASTTNPTASTPPTVSGLIKSTNPNLPMYSFKPLPNGNVEIYDNGKPISSGGGFSPSYAQGLGYSPPAGQQAVAPSPPESATAGYTFTLTPSGTVQISKNGSIVATTTPQVAAQQYGYQATAGATPSPAPLTSGHATTPSGAIVDVATGQLVSPPPPNSSSTATPTASSYSFSSTQYGTVQVFKNGQLIATTTSQLAAQQYGYQLPGAGGSKPTPVPAPLTSGYATTPSGAVVDVATGRLVSPPPNSVSPAPAQSLSPAPPGAAQSTTPIPQPIPSPPSASNPWPPATGATVQPAQSNTQIALQSPAISTSRSTTSPAITTNVVPSPGGISLNRAAAERMPLNFTLDGAYLVDGRLILSGPESSDSIDAALLMTSVRAACENEDLYFSLDPDNGAVWLREGQEASHALWERIKQNFKTQPSQSDTRRTDGILQIATISARRDYPQIWDSLSQHYPNLQSRLVFKPEWLRQTRLGEILYRADVLLKELSYGVPVLEPGPLRAKGVKGYAPADQRGIAQLLLSALEKKPSGVPEWTGTRLWFDLIPDPIQRVFMPGPHFGPANFVPMPTTAVIRPLIYTREIGKPPSPLDQLQDLLLARGLLNTGPTEALPPQINTDGGVVDLSRVSPRMFIRRHDQATGQDIPGNDPDLDDLARSVNAQIDAYVNAYHELRALSEVFRAYVAAVHLIGQTIDTCDRLRELPLLDTEKVAQPLPLHHPSELFITVGSFEYSEQRTRILQPAQGFGISGGVSVAARPFLSDNLRSASTAITQVIQRGVAQADIKKSAWQLGDRRFISFDILADLPNRDNFVEDRKSRGELTVQPHASDRNGNTEEQEEPDIENAPPAAPLPPHLKRSGR
jgi:hypothetical protein